MATYEFATMEWLWDQDSIRINLPDNVERMYSGSYHQVTAILSDLSAKGWDVATCAATGNWLLWTLRHTT